MEMSTHEHASYRHQTSTFSNEINEARRRRMAASPPIRLSLSVAIKLAAVVRTSIC